MMTATDKPKTRLKTDIRIFVTDCEGPISKNDNAFELTRHYIPRGDDFFTRVSRYDDILADIIKKPGYKAGDTLKLILPFLKAYGANDKKIIDYSKRNILLLSGAGETLRYLKDIMPSYIVSTSYQHYIECVCSVTEFPIENTYSTLVQFDKYELIEEEKKKIKHLCQEILEMPILNFSSANLEDFSVKDRCILERLDNIFWSEVSSMECGKLFSEVNPIGAEEKAKAIEEIALKNNCDLKDIIYIGDSITDLAPLRLVREAGGLAVSFNGNEYALREAEVSVISGTTIPTTALVYLFKKGGKPLVFNAVSDWTTKKLQTIGLPSRLINALISYSSEIPIVVSKITEENRMLLKEKSDYARKMVRGEAVGALG